MRYTPRNLWRHDHKYTVFYAGAHKHTPISNNACCAFCEQAWGTKLTYMLRGIEGFDTRVDSMTTMTIAFVFRRLLRSVAVFYSESVRTCLCAIPFGIAVKCSSQPIESAAIIWRCTVSVRPQVCSSVRVHAIYMLETSTYIWWVLSGILMVVHSKRRRMHLFGGVGMVLGCWRVWQSHMECEFWSNVDNKSADNGSGWSDF